MMRNALANKLLSFARAHDMFPPGAPVLCAVSGGADSVALLGALRMLRDTLGLGAVAAAHFNHQLRAAASDADEVFVRELCAQWDIPLYTGRADVAAEAKRRRAGIEETARDLRYGFLTQTAEQAGFSRVATGHTADDNVETVLLHLARGAGLSGLTGIPPVRGIFLRPLLTCTRAEVEDFLSAQGTPHIEDATNMDLSLSRNRVRHQAVPALRALNPVLADAVTGLTARLRRDEEYLTAQAEKELTAVSPAGLSYPASRLAALPPALAGRVCRLLYARAAGRSDAALSGAHVEALLRLCAGRRPSARLSLPEGLTARRDYDTLVIGPPLPPPSPFAPVALTHGAHRTKCLDIHILPTAKAGRSEPFHFFLAPATLRGDLTARARQTGDRLVLPGRPGGKSIRRLMIDAKIPAHLRDVWPVIVDEGGPLAVPGLGVDASHRAAPGSEAVEIVCQPPP